VDLGYPRIGYRLDPERMRVPLTTPPSDSKTPLVRFYERRAGCCFLILGITSQPLRILRRVPRARVSNLGLVFHPHTRGPTARRAMQITFLRKLVALILSVKGFAFAKPVIFRVGENIISDRVCVIGHDPEHRS
jgi:hypothetical protein